MKRRTFSLIIISIVMLTTFLSSCRKDFQSGERGVERTSTMQNLKIDPAFNWATSREVTVKVPGTMTGVIRITSTDGSVVYHKANMQGGSDMLVTIAVPKLIRELALNGTPFAVGEGECGPGSLKEAAANPVTFGGSITFNTSETRSPDAVALDDARFLITYSKGDYSPSYIKVGTKSGSGITFGTEYLLPGSGWAFYATATHILKVNPTTFLVVYKTSDSNGGVVLGTVAGSTITFHSSISAGGGINFPSIAMLDNDHFIFGYSNESTDAGYARLCTISGTEITAGTEYNWEPCQHLNVVRIDDTHALFAYRHAGTGEIRAYVVTWSVSGLSPSSSAVIEPGNSHYVSADMLDPTHFMITYSEEGSDYKAFSRIGTLSGTSITVGARTQVSDYQSEGHHVFPMGANKALLLYSEYNGSTRKCYYRTAEISGTLISLSAATFMTNGYGITPSVCALGSNHLLATWRLHDQPVTGQCFLSAPLIPDTDADGIGDPDDDYPTDPTRAFDNFFPASGYGTLGFEDLWPAKGDYDFNDVVVDYRFQTVTNAANNVVEIFARFKLQANGATFDNGFGFNLPNCDPTLTGTLLKITGYHLSRSYIALNSNGNETGQAKPTMIVWDNTSDLMPDLSNTDLLKPYVDAVELTLILTTPGYFFPAPAFAVTTFNPFIICNMERGKEVHLADRPPTTLVNPAYFGVWDDNTVPSSGRYYKTAGNLPWAIDIPEPFAWPVEKAEITTAHLKFAEWAQSSGLLYPDWYQSKPGYRNNSNIYSHYDK